MEESRSDSSLDDRVISDTEISAVENTAVNETDIVNPNQEIENMEVHHPHHVTHKKKWGEYLLEFFMLFLAVFLGFIAENFREISIERHREKEYIESMVKDLKTDTANLSAVIITYQKQVKMQDSLLNSFDLIDNGGNKNFLNNLGAFQGYPDFVNADATLQQLKNAGGFRLIKNKNAVDSIFAYTAATNKTFINTNGLTTYLINVSNFLIHSLNIYTLKMAMDKGFDFDKLREQNLSLFISKDKADKERLFGHLYSYSHLMKVILQTNFIPLKQHATRLITVLEKEYHLESK